jgi:CopG antitoxin of type II toxin-antitoxin system
MPNKKLKTLPRFHSEDEEREFWATHDSGDYVDWSKSELITEPGAFPNLKLSEDLVEFKIPMTAVKSLELMAAKRRTTKDAVARRLVLEGLKREHQSARA